MRPKVLFILHFPPPVHGSSVVGKQIYDSLLINRSVIGTYINLSTSRLMEEIGKQSFRKYGRALGIYFQALWQLSSRKYDICYLAIAVTGLGLLRDFPLVVCAKLFAGKVLIHQHNKGVSLYKDKFPYPWMYRKLYHRTKVILLSWSLYDEISDYVNKKDVFICPNGLDPLESYVGGK